MVFICTKFVFHLHKACTKLAQLVADMELYDSHNECDERSSPFTVAMRFAQRLDSPVPAEVSDSASTMSSDASSDASSNVSRDTDFMEVTNAFMCKISDDVSLQTGKIRVLENELTLLQEKKGALEKIRSLWKPWTDGAEDGNPKGLQPVEGEAWQASQAGNACRDV